MKLSKAQQEVVDLMREGWELGVSTDFTGRCWLQKGGCGKGGETKDVRSTTVGALREAGVIKICGYSFPTTRYQLAT